MTERDVLLGFVHERARLRVGPLPRSGPNPREALEQVLVAALSKQPCKVSFSGGRDSSAVLATALDVARRHGLPEPAAFTLRYPGTVGTDEDQWQQAVIAHLRPADWQVVEIDARSAELLGPVGTASLRANGLLWPPTLHLENGWLARAQGTTIITGEGGDEVLGPHRATPLRTAAQLLRHHPRDLDLLLLRRVVREAAPAGARVTAARRRMSRTGYLSWLRPPFRDEALTQVASLTARVPWSWSNSLRGHLGMPALVLALANRDWLAAAYGARFIHPLLDPGFVDAVARHGGPLGYAGRTDAMRRIFGDLLPPAVLARSTKAAFNKAYNGSATRSFAEAWDGTGIDPRVVDIGTLRTLWLAEQVHAGTNALLQAAWLATNAPNPGPAGQPAGDQGLG